MTVVAGVGGRIGMSLEMLDGAGGRIGMSLETFDGAGAGGGRVRWLALGIRVEYVLVKGVTGVG
jgi:hypothetical protein